MESTREGRLKRILGEKGSFSRRLLLNLPHASLYSAYDFQQQAKIYGCQFIFGQPLIVRTLREIFSRDEATALNGFQYARRLATATAHSLIFDLELVGAPGVVTGAATNIAEMFSVQAYTVHLSMMGKALAAVAKAKAQKLQFGFTVPKNLEDGECRGRYNEPRHIFVRKLALQAVHHNFDGIIVPADLVGNIAKDQQFDRLLLIAFGAKAKCQLQSGQNAISIEEVVGYGADLVIVDNIMPDQIGDVEAEIRAGLALRK